MEKETIVEEEKSSKKTPLHRILGVVYNVLFLIVVIFVLAETTIGVLNIQKINAGEDLLWYIDSKVVEKNSLKITTYNLGLYVIQKTEDQKSVKVVLKPFFIK